MIFAEPPRTRFDVGFKLGRVPVRIHPFFWVSTLGLSLRPGVTFAHVAIWCGAVLVSILVHELGHAIAFRRFGYESRITLYGFGGLASADGGHGRLSTRAHILISAAGPFAGFAFAGVIAAILLQLGYRVPLVFWTLGSGRWIANPLVSPLVFDLMAINVLWGVMNLLPVQPLDGGQIALEIARARDPVHGVERSVWLSFFVGTIVAVVGLLGFGDTFTALLFGYLAYMSWQVLKRRYHTGFGSLAVVKAIRRRGRAVQKGRARRAIQASVAKELQSLDAKDEAGAEGAGDAEIDRVVGELFENVAKGVLRVPGKGRGKP
jgi:stage IV sporulation protein FB